MPFIKPSRPQYKPENDLTESGQFLAVCNDVRFGLENKRFPNGKPNMAIEFRIEDPDCPGLRGKLCSIICGESIYLDKVARKESRLVAHARLMGVRSPEQGFDPEQFIGRWYRVQVEQDGESGRCYVRAAMPAHPPAGEPPAGKSGPQLPPPGETDEVPF